MSSTPADFYGDTRDLALALPYQYGDLRVPEKLRNLATDSQCRMVILGDSTSTLGANGKIPVQRFWSTMANRFDICGGFMSFFGNLSEPRGSGFIGVQNTAGAGEVHEGEAANFQSGDETPFGVRPVTFDQYTSNGNNGVNGAFYAKFAPEGIIESNGDVENVVDSQDALSGTLTARIYFVNDGVGSTARVRTLSRSNDRLSWFGNTVESTETVPIVTEIGDSYFTEEVNCDYTVDRPSPGLWIDSNASDAGNRICVAGVEFIEQGRNGISLASFSDGGLTHASHEANLISGANADKAQEFMQLYSPNVLLLLLGTNDLGRTENQFKETLENLLDGLRVVLPNTLIVTANGTPIDNAISGHENEITVGEFNVHNNIAQWHYDVVSQYDENIMGINIRRSLFDDNWIERRTSTEVTAPSGQSLAASEMDTYMNDEVHFNTLAGSNSYSTALTNLLFNDISLINKTKIINAMAPHFNIIG